MNDQTSVGRYEANQNINNSASDGRVGLHFEDREN